jgi:hypothetical protein
MVVMGDEQYFKCADYSITSFCKNNFDYELIVFTDKEHLKYFKYSFDNLYIEDFNKWFEQFDFKTTEIYSKPFDNYGKQHNHKFISHIFPMMQNYGYADYLVKLDCDMYFTKNVIKELEKEITNHDFYLIKRKHPMMKLYSGGLPGVGVVIFKRESNFVSDYIKYFTQITCYEQDIVLGLRDKMPYKEIQNESFHIVFPFMKNPNLTKQELDNAFAKPKIIHCHLLEQLKILGNWYD